MQMLRVPLLILLLSSLSSGYEVCCHLFPVTDLMLDFNTLSMKHEQRWQQAGYIPKIYNEYMARPNNYVVIPVDQKTAYYFLNSPNNYTKCYDCTRIDPQVNNISRQEVDRMQWLSNYVKISQHDYVVCQTQLESQNWTTGYIVAAVTLVLFLLFGATAVVTWLYTNFGKLK